MKENGKTVYKSGLIPINTYIMFSKYKTYFAVLLITGITCWYVCDEVEADNALLKAQSIELERGIEEQNKVLEQQKKDFQAIMESNKKLNDLIGTFQKDQKTWIKDLQKKIEI